MKSLTPDQNGISFTTVLKRRLIPSLCVLANSLLQSSLVTRKTVGLVSLVRHFVTLLLAKVFVAYVAFAP